MSQPNQRRFRLTASVAVSHFKHRCDRRFRWGVVARGDRGKPGIGWNVPAYERAHSRPGIALLMTAGDEFELERLHALEASLATAPPVPGVEARVHHAGTHTERGRERVAPLPLADTLDLLRRPLPPRFVAQVEINLAPYPAMEASFLHRFGLDPDLIELGVSRPDLVEILPPDANHALRRLRVWDFKGSEEPRHEHFIQVAFYVLLLQAVLEEAGLADFALDTEVGVIEARNGRNEFDLAPYLLALSDFLQNRVPTLLATPAADAHFHVHEGCMLCEHMDECRTRANASFDLSRIPYITSESKRHLLTAGFRSHPDLAALDITSDQQTIEQLRQLSHDLSTNVARYIAAAQALQDGVPRVLDKRSFQMPAYEDIRVVLCAEQDAVTGTCFALGIKTYEGWDTANNRPLGQEHVFIARKKGDEVSILLPFLRTLNRFLDRVDAANEAVRSQPIDTDPRVVAAEQAWDDAKASCASFKADHAEALKSKKRDPHTAALRAERDALEAAAKAAGKVVKEVRGNVTWEQRRAQKKLHFYIYDTLDVLALRGLFERQLLAAYPPALLVELSQLIRLFPPESVLPDAETFRTIPFTIIVQMLRAMVALPIAYGYDLRTVSELYQPAKGGFQFRTPYGFSWEHSNQVAFERIHDVWNNETFSHRQRTYKPLEILPEIEKAVLAKLRATDSVIRRLKEDLKERLLLKKEPFRLFKASDPIQVQKLEALRIFTTLEVSYDELETKRTHTLPVADRVAGFICIHGLQALATELDAEGTLWTMVPLAAESDDLIEFLLHPERPVLLVRYRPSRSFTARNPLEAELAAQLVARLSTLLIDQEHNAVYTPHQFCAEGVAVLAPHRAQNSTIRQLLRGYGFGTETQPMPLVDTVDKLQGQERDVVVMSYGVADSEYAEGEAEFLLSSNRFNVAATRARHKLIVICADTVLDLVPAEQQVLYDAMMLKEFRRYCDSGQRGFRWAVGNEQIVSFQVQWKEFER